MIKQKNIILNHTLKEYENKYKVHSHLLLKITKKQVEDFDKKHGYYSLNNKSYKLDFDHYLLNNRKWWLIDDTYYEIPKAPRWTWFRNLNIKSQCIICGIGLIGISSAIVFPVLANTIWKDSEAKDIVYTEINVDYNPSGFHYKEGLFLNKTTNYKFVCILGNEYSQCINGDSFFDINDEDGDEQTNNVIDIISISYNSNKLTYCGFADTEEKFNQLQTYLDSHPNNYYLANYVDGYGDRYDAGYIAKNSFNSVNHKLEICVTCKKSLDNCNFIFGFPI